MGRIVLWAPYTIKSKKSLADPLTFAKKTGIFNGLEEKEHKHGK